MPLVGYRVGSRNSLRSTVHFLKFPEPIVCFMLFQLIATSTQMLLYKAATLVLQSLQILKSNSQTQNHSKNRNTPQIYKKSSCLHVTFLNSDVIFPSGSPGLLQRRAAHPCGSSQEGGEGGAHCWIFLWGTTSR